MRLSSNYTPELGEKELLDFLFNLTQNLDEKQFPPDKTMQAYQQIKDIIIKHFDWVLDLAEINKQWKEMHGSKK